MSKYTPICLCSSCSLISASWRQQCLVLFFYFPLPLRTHTNTHTGAPHPFVSVSNLWTHTSLRRFHSSRPTVFLLDDTAAPANRLQRQDISRNLTFMGLVFSLAPILHGTHLAFSVLVSSRTPVRKSLRFWLSCCRIFKERKKQKGDLNPFWGWPIQPSGGTAGEACISTCTWLAHCLRRTPMLASTLSSSSPEKLPNNN